MSKLDQLRGLREQRASAVKGKSTAKAKDHAPKIKGPAPSKKRRAKKKAASASIALRPSPIRGRPRLEDRDKTLTATEPWKALGFSRRTYFRRVAEKKRVDNSMPK